jgi:hypothetical protein
MGHSGDRLTVSHEDDHLNPPSPTETTLGQRSGTEVAIPQRAVLRRRGLDHVSEPVFAWGIVIPDVGFVSDGEPLSETCDCPRLSGARQGPLPGAPAFQDRTHERD